MVSIPEHVVAQMHQHLVQEHPKEGCGAVLRDPSGGWQVVSMDNVHSQPRLGYQWSEDQQRKLWEQMDRTSEQLWGIYHSHTETDPSPSSTDIAAAWYPSMYYIIFSLVADVTEYWFEVWQCLEPGQLTQVRVDIT